MHHTMIPLLSLALLVCCTSAGFAADWPPTIDTKNQTTRALDGRTIERYVHGVQDKWGYPAPSDWTYHEAQETGAKQQNHSSFYVVSPLPPKSQRPLSVVLHSANRTAYDYLGFSCLNRKIDGGDDPATSMTNTPAEFYTLYLNSTNDEWWGWTQARQSPNFARHLNAPPPAEQRVLDTIEWVVTHYNIDRNRIYLCGTSMGGCGSLGIGLPHGDVFAAVLGNVPAGTAYACYRLGGLSPLPAPDAPQTERDAWLKRAACVGLPDPPVLVDFSSQADGWSVTQPPLVSAAQVGRLPLVLGWGPFGHPTFASLIAKYPPCEVALAFPWLEIRKNEAYPVFTHASSDQHSPWLNAPAEYDDAGQMNAYFRWQNQQDTPASVTLQIWLAHPKITNPKLPMPIASTTDITLRRLQQFKVHPGQTYTWQWTRDGKIIASRQVTPDAANLLTIPQLSVTTVPATLTLHGK